MPSQGERNAMPTANAAPCGEKVKRLERWLLSPDKLCRMAAMREIDDARCPEKKRFVMESLVHTDPEIRRFCVNALGKMKEEMTNEDISYMDVFLNSKDPAVRHDVVHAMVMVLSADCAETVSRLLSAHLEREGNKPVLNISFSILWAIEAANRKNRSFKSLLDFLSSDNETFRDATAQQIRKYREILTGEDISAIASLLDDDTRGNQVAALRALMYIDKPAQVASALMHFFDDMEMREPETIKLAIDVLGSLRRDPDIEKFLHGMHDSGDAKYASFKEQIADILSDTMRIVPMDAVIRKDSAAEDIFFGIIDRPRPVRTDS